MEAWLTKDDALFYDRGTVVVQALVPVSLLEVYGSELTMFLEYLSVYHLDMLAVMLGFSLMVVFLYVFDLRGSSKKASIPGEDPSDAEAGNLTDMGKAGSLHEYMLFLHEKFGPIAGFWWGKKYVVSLASPEHWKEVQHLFDRPVDLFKLFEPLIGKQSIQYANGREGRKRRQLVDRSFSHEAVIGYYDMIVKVAKDRADKLATFSSQQHIPLGKQMLAMTIKNITVAGMGSLFTEEQELDKLAKAYKECWKEMEARLTRSPPAPDSEEERTFQRARTYLHDLVKDLITHRRHSMDKDGILFIDSMLDCDFMNEEELCDQVITFLIGGFQTTASMLTWCLYFLTKHPEIQEKVFQEIEEVLGDEDIKPGVASELRFTRQVLDETLRTAVVAPWAARICDHDLKVEGFVIPKQTPVLFPIGLVLQDANLWPEPNRFDPDRFSPENLKHLPSLAYQPFGFAGKRKCPACRFAIAEGLVSLAVLIKRFKFHLVANQEEVKPMYGLVGTPAQEIWVTVSKR